MSDEYSKYKPLSEYPGFTTCVDDPEIEFEYVREGDDVYSPGVYFFPFEAKILNENNNFIKELTIFVNDMKEKRDSEMEFRVIDVLNTHNISDYDLTKFFYNSSTDRFYFTVWDYGRKYADAYVDAKYVIDKFDNFCNKMIDL